MAEILKDGIEKCAGTSLAHLRLDGFDPPKLEERGTPGLVWRHSLPAMFVNQQVEGGAHFVVEILLDAVTLDYVSYEGTSP